MVAGSAPAGGRPGALVTARERAPAPERARAELLRPAARARVQPARRSPDDADQGSDEMAPRWAGAVAVDARVGGGTLLRPVPGARLSREPDRDRCRHAHGHGRSVHPSRPLAAR